MLRTLALCFIFSINTCYAEVQPSGSSSLKVLITPPLNEDTNLNTYHIVGNFNNWSFDEPQPSLLKLKSGKLVADLPLKGEPLFFTVVKNMNWEQLPATLAGKSVCTYMYNPEKDTAPLNIHIANWKSGKTHKELNSTASGDIRYHQDIDMPLLDRKTNISVYLPASYKNNLTKKYPVLYMLDGQNLFDASTAYSDEWKIDEILEQLTTTKKLPEIIVVGIDNGLKRWNEYNAWDFIGANGKKEKGLGRVTVSFIKNTLKPFIDTTYRTKGEISSTGFSGSSLGGLMSIYVAMEHSDTFGFVAAFSPSLGVKNSDNKNVIESALTSFKSKIPTKIYLDMGRMEYGNYDAINNLHKMLLQKVTSVDNVKLIKDDLGRHCEIDWSKRFPNALTWLLNTKTSQK